MNDNPTIWKVSLGGTGEARKYFDSWMQLKPYNPVTPEEDDDDSNE